MCLEYLLMIENKSAKYCSILQRAIRILADKNDEDREYYLFFEKYILNFDKYDKKLKSFLKEVVCLVEDFALVSDKNYALKYLNSILSHEIQDNISGFETYFKLITAYKNKENIDIKNKIKAALNKEKHLT